MITARRLPLLWCLSLRASRLVVVVSSCRAVEVFAGAAAVAEFESAVIAVLLSRGDDLAIIGNVGIAIANSKTNVMLAPLLCRFITLPLLCEFE